MGECSEGIRWICVKHSCGNKISIKFRCGFGKISLQHGCFSVSLLCIIGVHVPYVTSDSLLVAIFLCIKIVKLIYLLL